MQINYIVFFQILGYFIWGLLLGRLALKKGRNGVIWFFISILISPILSWVILDQIGDTKELRAQKLALRSNIDEEIESNKDVDPITNEENFKWNQDSELIKIESKQIPPIPISVIKKENTTNDNKNNQEPQTINRNIKSFIIVKKLEITQKIILSISFFLLFLLLAIVYSLHINQKMRLTETWHVWFCFILLQAWLQNKIWTLKNSIVLNFKTPDLTKIKNWLLKNWLKATIVLITSIVISLISLFIFNQWNKMLERKRIEQLAEFRKLPSKKNLALAIDEAMASIKYEEGRLCLDITLNSDFSKRKVTKARLRNLHSFIDKKNNEQIISAPSWESRPKMILEDQSTFIVTYLDEGRLFELYNYLVKVGYLKISFDDLLHTMKNKLPENIKVTFLNRNGYELYSVLLNKSQMYNDGNKFSFTSFFGEKASLKESDFIQICDWRIERN